MDAETNEMPCLGAQNFTVCWEGPRKQNYTEDDSYISFMHKENPHIWDWWFVCLREEAFQKDLPPRCNYEDKSGKMIQCF